jgi:hypothetical protein
MAVQHFCLLNGNQRRVASRQCARGTVEVIQELEIEKCIREAK